MDYALLSCLFTVLSMVVFLGIMFWAFNKRNKSKFESIGRSLVENENE